MQTKHTIHDIARRAGVGATTVSRVLNDHPYVSEATRKKVMDAIAALDYRPSYSARHMRTRSSRLIGFVADEVATTPWAVDMIKGAHEASWEQSKLLLVVSAGRDLKVTEEAVEVLLERQVEGIIYAAMYHRPVRLPENIAKVPTVLADCFVEDRSLPSVVPDEVQGGRDATLCLLEKGHRRIGFINLGAPKDGGDPVPAATGRLQGYKEALSAYGVPYDETLIRYTDQRPETHYRLTQELLALPNPPTAIFCGNDRTAMGCYGVLKEMGLRIPEDVAVVSYDNQLDIAQGLWPPLTSAQLPHYEMGKWAVDFLLSHDAPLPPVQHKLECPLVRRASV
jgi:LacI family transcriptional regulator